MREKVIHMKKWISVIAVLLALTMLGSVTAFADTLPLEEPEETVIELVDLEAGETPDSYTVVDDGETVLIVDRVRDSGVASSLSDALSNGFYSADFMLSDGISEVFLTGLTRDNVSEIEQAIKNGYSSGNFKLSDLGFLDTEKTRDADDDDEMCWAAASSNLLAYTGWGAQAGYTDPDDLFELYIDSFENKGGHPYWGIGWFFNGIKNTNSTAALPVNYPNSGAYLSNYAFDEIASTVAMQQTGAQGMGQIYRALREGCGAAVNVTLFKGSQNMGGHSVSCWGFVTDTRYAEDSKAFYKSLIITDSDSDEMKGVDRRTAPDIMSAFALTSYVYGSNDTYSFRITSDQTAIITDGTVIRPYRADLPRETSSSATRNRRTTADLLFNELRLGSEESADGIQTKYAVGDSIYYAPSILNMGEKNYSGNFSFKITVTDVTGKQWYTYTADAGTATIKPNRIVNFTDTFKINKALPAGDYTATFSVNPLHAVKEAYYYNNEKSIDFKVRDTYFLGDADNDGDISVIDATMMQRTLATFDADLTGAEALRGDIDRSGDLDVIDVTLLQRYLVYIDISYAVGDTLLYD